MLELRFKLTKQTPLSPSCSHSVAPRQSAYWDPIVRTFSGHSVNHNFLVSFIHWCLFFKGNRLLLFFNCVIVCCSNSHRSPTIACRLLPAYISLLVRCQSLIEMSITTWARKNKQSIEIPECNSCRMLKSLKSQGLSWNVSDMGWTCATFVKCNHIKDHQSIP